MSELKPRLRVVAAMSGGVDSAVAAARAIDAGHDVVGVHLALAPSEVRAAGDPTARTRGCCTLSDAHDARRSADVLGIPFYVWDMAAEFAEEVLDDFVSEYAAGRTPNPCVRCNEKIKFAAVLDRAQELGFDAVATGHYAQIFDVDGERELHRAIDPTKDQSYVLGVLDEHQVALAMFPLGDSLKSDVRQEARERGLLVANKPDSHDICFIPDGDTAGFLQQRLGTAPGDVVDAVSGDVLGTHDGAYSFTIGQRRGVGLKTAPADGAPRYVVGVDVATRTVSVGPPTLLNVDRIFASNLRWTSAPVQRLQRVGIQIRAHGEEMPAVVMEIGAGHLQLGLDESIRGVAPGQTVVLYEGTRVIGSGTISKTARG